MEALLGGKKAAPAQSKGAAPWQQHLNAMILHNNIVNKGKG
jgi:hypothetical protein